jgi:hypothetical protein
MADQPLHHDVNLRQQNFDFSLKIIQEYDSWRVAQGAFASPDGRV